MAKIDTLYEGYVNEGEDVELVRNTVSLIRDGKFNIIVDPGLVESPDVIVVALGKFNLKIEDITHVYITHYHMDHVRYVGLFKNAIIMDYKYVYEGEKWGEHSGDGHKITNDITILQTPGHTMDDSALLVKTSDGIYAISHVWWFPDRTPVEDPMAVDQALLEQSRVRVEKLADWIITPHGGMLKVR